MISCLLYLKRFTKYLKVNKLSDKGFTLIEVLAVIVIIGILAAIAVPSVGGLIEKSKEDVCDVNRVQVKRMYEMNLTLESMDHSDGYFTQFVNDYGTDICPDGGVISYVDGEVECSVHSVVGEIEEEDGSGGVPFF